MSTKIYWAYRFPLTRWVEFIDLIHDQMFSIVVARILELMVAVEIDSKEFDNECVKYKIKNPDKYEKRYRFHKVMDRCQETSGRIERNPLFDMDCSVNFWIREDMVYAMPVCEYWIKTKLEIPEWVEDYRYWNDVDVPEDVPEDDFYKRGEVWREICTGTGKARHNARRISHCIVDLDKYSNVGKVDLQMEIFPENFKEGKFHPRSG